MIGTGVALAGALAYIGLADPHRPGFLFPACPFKALTGLDCPAGGGLVGGLVGMGIPEDEAKVYNERLEAGDIVVSVVAGSREAEARQILQGDGVISTNLHAVDATTTRTNIVS